MKRVHNYNAGPAAIPTDALEYAAKEFLDFQGSGMSIMEVSHRSKLYDQVHNEAGNLVRELMGLSDEFHVLFLQGGASLQFAMVPMNFLWDGASADYVITGTWAQKAFKEAQIIGKCKIAGSSEESHFTEIPTLYGFDDDAQYVHITSNNTIKGTQFFDFPDTGKVPLVADMSSDILWRPFDASKFGLIYAGAQKNLGPSGVTLVIVREDMLRKANPNLPTMLKYQTFVDKNSLYNTPPTFGIYMVRNVLNWIMDLGGLAAMEKQNTEKANLLYKAIDGSGGFYKNPIKHKDRSVMNVVFRLPSELLEAKFVAQGEENGFIGLKGHRSVGGCRVSMYNATSVDSIKDLTGFMKDFMSQNG